MKRRWRVAAWTGVGTLAVPVLALAWGEAVGWPLLREPLQKAAARASGVAVRMDEGFRVHFLVRPRLEVGHLQIAPAHALPLPHLLDARGVTVEWRWRDIWRWRHDGAPLRLARLRADTFDARLLRVQDGRASWQLGRGAQPQAAAAAQEPLHPLDGVPRFALLQVREGHIAVDDQPLQTQLQAELRGAEGRQLPDGTRAGYEARVSGRWKALPMLLQVRTGGTLAQLQDGSAPLLPLRIEGQVGAAQVLFDGRSAPPGEPPSLEGRIHASGPSLARVGEPLGVTLPQTPPFDLRGTVALAGRVWQLHAERAAIGRSLLDGDFSFDRDARPPRLKGRLGGTRLLLADLAPAVGKAPGGRSERAATGRVLPQRRFDLPSLNAMEADLQVAIDELDFGSDAVSPFRALRTHLLLNDGVLQLDQLQAEVAGGRFGGHTSLDARSQPARWAADLRFSGVDLVDWLPVLRTGRNQPAQAYLTGMMSGVVQVTGRGRSTAEILASADGRAQLTLRDGTLSHLATELAGLDLAQALGVLVMRDRPLPLRCARVDLQLQDGVATPRLAVLDNRDSTIRIDGRIDLRDESLALRAVSQPKDFSPLSLRTPIVVGGTLAAPKPGIEGGRLAGKVLGALALGAVVAPLAALLPLVDPGQREAADPCSGALAAAAPAPASQVAPAR